MNHTPQDPDHQINQIILVMLDTIAVGGSTPAIRESARVRAEEIRSELAMAPDDNLSAATNTL